MIHVRRTWTCGQVGLPKTKASKGPVPLHPLLAEFLLSWKQKTPYSQPSDWVFASLRLNGKKPRVANMLVEDYLRPAAAKAGILSSHRDDCGRLMEDDSRRFGFHNLRHSLASFLVRIRTDPKTVQTLLRHSAVTLFRRLPMIVMLHETLVQEIRENVATGAPMKALDPAFRAVSERTSGPFRFCPRRPT